MYGAKTLAGHPAVAVVIKATKMIAIDIKDFTARYLYTNASNSTPIKRDRPTAILATVRN
jgi:hypothetical protein